MRNHSSSTFKAQMVQEVLQGEQTIAQFASEHSVHPNLIGLWQATALARFPSLVETDGADRVAERLAHEQQLRALDEELGRLTTQVAFSSRKAGVRDE